MYLIINTWLQFTMNGNDYYEFIKKVVPFSGKHSYLRTQWLENIWRFVHVLSGQPDILEGDDAKIEVDKLRKAIQDQKMAFSFDEYEWWVKFLQDPLGTIKDMSPEPQWYLNELKSRCQTSEAVVPSQLRKKELHHPSVHSSGSIRTGKQKVAKGIDVQRGKGNDPPCKRRK